MTSAVLPSRRDEPRWTEPAVFMKKHPSFNPNPSLPSSNRAGAAGVSSDGYVTFRMASYSSSELRELKRRLVSELEQVRSLLSRIESSRPGSGFGSADANSAPVLNPPAKSGPSAAALKKCGQILNRLMKHKKQMWFNTPVDVVGMNLHDYYQIVNQPMDLGTVKSRLSKGLYQSAEDFAYDVRLTFNNALLYNPKGHVVHELAFELLNLFDKLFNPVSDSYRSQSAASTPVTPTPPAAPPPVTAAPVVTPPAPKLPKPKARDQNKRAMTYEEKQRLSEGLQNLPEEKMMQVVGIVRKRNLDTTQEGDEIELDIDTMDNETLWELDRFVSNCKKSMWKHRRREGEGETLGVAGFHAANHVAADVAASVDDVVAAPMIDVGSDEPDQPAHDTKRELGEEEVDIGEEMPAVHYPPVSLEIQKDDPAQGSSGSSGSGSGSSSSSDSDSASSSSSSGSDGSGTRSPAVGSRSKSPPKN